ncbi:MAG TPA: MBL fold metallo-hydrolase [Saprospiraceae bacterium]|nr:MBL fold metallo-hydrolase [Saprospiraceae bacterium]HMQ81927.1 MBL fold metallo-hydrolase [Saprospiraceae bacterium]
MEQLEVILTGTGTSQGVPVIGCSCEVCHSDDKRDHRLRTAAVIQYRNRYIGIDCGPDFRQQMLREGITDMQAILITHEHNDHVIGMDDVRPFNFMSRQDMPMYCTEQVAQSLKNRFDYVFNEQDRYPGAPRVALQIISGQMPFYVDSLPIQPIQVWHGRMPVLGFRIGEFAYLTDVKFMEDSELDKLKGIKALVINALHHEAHYSHLNLAEALELIARIAPEKAWLTHCSHRMGRYEAVQKTLPEGVFLGYDGLRIVSSI